MNVNERREQRDRHTQNVLNNVNNSVYRDVGFNGGFGSGGSKKKKMVYVQEELSESQKRKYDIIKIVFSVTTLIAIGLMSYYHANITFDLYTPVVTIMGSKAMWIPFIVSQGLMFCILMTTAVITPIRNVRTCGIYCTLSYVSSCIIALIIMQTYWMFKKNDTIEKYDQIFAYIVKYLEHYKWIFTYVFANEDTVDDNIKQIKDIVRAFIVKNNSSVTT